MPKTTGNVSNETAKKLEEKRPYLGQNEFPLFTLSDAVKVAEAINDNFGTKPALPHQVALALNISPTSSKWIQLASTALAYGLINAGARATQMSLTDLGKRIVALEEEGDDEKAKIEAVLKPTMINDFFRRYDRSKFPKVVIAKNVLVTMGIPKEKVDEAYNLILANGKYTRIIQDTKAGLFVSIEGAISSQFERAYEERVSIPFNQVDEEDNISENLASRLDLRKDSAGTLHVVAPPIEHIAKTRVFISHGKNRQMLEQLKELLTFGQFDVVVSIEKESTAIPVPEKVFSDMRSCQAAVIHVEGDKELIDKDGTVHKSINENVLIEIGAAIALYNKRFILLCEESLELPSNLQGLYRCNYNGKELTYDAAMKLQRTFNEIRSSTV